MSHEYLVLNPSVTFRLAAGDSEEIQIVAGEGSRRVELAIENPQVVSWLLKLRHPCTRDDATQKSVSVLGVSPNAVGSLIQSFLESGVLLNCCQEGIQIPESEVQWEKWGWRDALDFQRSTRDLLEA